MNQSACNRAILIGSLCLGLLLPSSLIAGTIARGTKASGGTAFADATTISAAEMNTDFDNMYNEFNGSIESGNIQNSTIVSADVAADTLTAADLAPSACAASEILDGTILNVEIGAAAAIDPSKLDDHSTDSTEHLAETTPGTSDAVGTLPTTVQGEILDIRGVLARLSIGPSCSEVNAGGATAASCNWIDGPVRGGNLIFNGGFDAINTLAATPTNGDGWTVVGTPSTLAQETLVANQGMGLGRGINIIADAATEGISQTLTQLRADSRYVALVDVRPDVTTCRIDTTGADTNQLSVDSASGGSAWQTIGGIFETDSTPTAVVVRLLAVSNLSDCVFDNLRVFMLAGAVGNGPDPIRQSNVWIEQECNSDPATFDAGGSPVNFSAEGGTDITVIVTPYSPNTIIEVWAHVSVVSSGAGGDFGVAIDEAGSDVSEGVASANASGQEVHIALNWVNINPAPGTAITYSLQATDLVGTFTFPEAGLSSAACLTVKMTSP